MKLVKVPAINGLGHTYGCEKAPDAIVKILDEIYSSESGKEIKFKVDEIKVNNNNIEETTQNIKEKVQEYFLREEKAIFLGGDHSITYNLVKEFAKKPNSGIIVFDAHPDCMKSGKEPNHEEWLRALIDQGFNPKKIILVGIRNSDPQELEFMKKQGINIFHMKELFDNLEVACDKIMEYARKFDNLYLSLDIDAVDPAFAPGTGYVEPGGLTSREFLYLIQRINLLKNLNAIDLVEVNPEKDINGMTLKLAAKVIWELL
jgi:agmatinase/proclavaminate amidinohydrolase